MSHRLEKARDTSHTDGRYDHNIDELMWREIVAATTAGSYEERTCMRCFAGRVFDIERGAWVSCERCSGTASGGLSHQRIAVT